MLKRILVLAMSALILLVSLTSCFASAAGRDKKILITEIVSKNKTLIDDEDGDSADYIELYNSGNSDINLNGWFLSDKEDDAKKWSFPDVTVKAGEYLVVFCSGKNKFIPETGEVHTSFKLDGDGEVVSLVSEEGALISIIKFGESASDAAYGLRELASSEYVWFERGTPGAENSGNFYAEIEEHPAYIPETDDSANE